MFALLQDAVVAETLGGVVGGIAPWAAGFFVLLAGIFGSNEKTVGALPLFFFAALACVATFVFAPDTGFWTKVEYVGWWGGGLLGALGAMLAFNQKGGNMRGLVCVGCVAAFAGLAMWSPQTTEVRLEAVQQQRAELEQQLDEDVAGLIEQQEEALEEVQAELAGEGLSSTRQRELEEEAREIVRFIIALEDHREGSRETLSRLRSLERTLQRQAGAEELLGSDEELLAQYETISREAGARLEVQLDANLGSGAIADQIVEQRYQELLNP